MTRSRLLLLVVLALTLLTRRSLAAAAAANDARPDRTVAGAATDDAEARELVQSILDQLPARRTILHGEMIVRDEEGRRSRIPIRYTVVPETEGWRGIYETQPTASRGVERLTIIRRRGLANDYVHAAAAAPGQAPGPDVTLRGTAAAVSFAGSDYWLTDLGLEFLHWKQQRLVRDAKITMRKGRPCKVIESTHPAPGPSDYARVVSWLDAESGFPIHAEGFDRAGRRLKTFSLRGFTKVDGQWQPKELEMLDERKDSKSALQFQFEESGNGPANPPRPPASPGQ